ncbi:two component LuxR family transcriptional regulator [Oscillochloris trichoides DG-6]|uniref:Two component LuxR family transcriptional regulator n=1 Tax=Oscillochloris trichoides DG-6 TaxID=765420 RepID=E1ID31_9CHLR|nr:two component LuxR family transcriptional regulator [Oscillochloris trichoides DG-6]
MLESEADFELVGEATNGQEAVDLCQALQPDLALLDIRMPQLDGLAATRLIRQIAPHTRVAIVTMHENPDYLVEALRAGVVGYVLKDSTRRTFVAAVRQALRGETFINGSMTVQLLQRLATTHESSSPPRIQLTRREQEVLQLITQGKTNREIGQLLNISVGTVKIHVEHIIAKLGVSDRTQAAVRAIDLGLLK